jgi:hypothetical protein
MRDGFSLSARNGGRRTCRARDAEQRGPELGRAGDTIPLGKRTLVVIGKRDDDGDQPPVLVVEEA